MVKILDFLCNMIWFIYLGVTKIIFIILYCLVFLFVFCWAGICRLGAVGRACKKIEKPFKVIWKYSFLLILDGAASCYKSFLDYASRTKVIKRVFAVFFIFFMAYIIYPPSHWGPWNLYEKGIASWYGPGFYWKTKADGNTYYPWSYSAASKTIKLGTTVKVINLENNKTVYVEIDDRGPFVKNRVIDLSYLAAVKLGMKNKGIAKVAIYVKK
jgi:hypothetical protein